MQIGKVSNALYRLPQHRCLSNKSKLTAATCFSDQVHAQSDWETKLGQDQLVQRNSEVVYAWEVDRLKLSCKEWQVKLDTDLENIEVLCTISKLALQKVKDDHKFFLEQEEMFRRRIAEETELMAAEEKIRQQKQVSYYEL